MKFIIFFATVIAVATAGLLPQNAVPSAPDAQAQVVSQQLDIAPDLSSYSYSSQTSNGISASQSGLLKQPQSVDASPVYIVQGQYSYIGADGNQYLVKYTADEFGFHPEGAHLPVAPTA